MLYNPPTFSYCGLTVVLSNPSRFDSKMLLSSTGGKLFSELLKPDYNRYQCDIRLKDETKPLLPNTKCILLLGEAAMCQWLQSTSNTLGQIRGSIAYKDNIPMIASFCAQDAADIKDWETAYNEKQAEEEGNELPDDDDEEGESDFSVKSRHGRTRRKNYRFWLSKDIEKCKRILKSGVEPALFKPDYRIYPQVDELIDVLSTTKDSDFYLDLETFWPSCDIKCCGFSFGVGKPIYVFPWYSYDRSWAYSRMPEVFTSFAIALRDNRAVAHNGSGFDFHVLANKYHLPPGKRVYDTMIAMHRCFSEPERSLGHCTSLWTNEPFHKDEGDVDYTSQTGMHQTMQYCGKDVYTMILIHKAIEKYASRIPGLQKSIDDGCRAIRPYLLTSLQGLCYKQEILDSIVNENNRLVAQYLILLEILVGKEILKELRGKGVSAMPGSNPQCVKYFHEMLGYPVVQKGKTKKDGTRGPSLAKDAMFKLKLKHPDNVVIDLVLACREIAKETGTLKFTPWERPDKKGIINEQINNRTSSGVSSEVQPSNP